MKDVSVGIVFVSVMFLAVGAIHLAKHPEICVPAAETPASVAAASPAPPSTEALWKDEPPIMAPLAGQIAEDQSRSVPFDMDEAAVSVLRTVPYDEYLALIAKLRELRAGCAAAASAEHRSGEEAFMVRCGVAYCSHAKADDMEGRLFWSTPVRLTTVGVNR